jgi:NO-binding membrane sensor protein with MHYT domain
VPTVHVHNFSYGLLNPVLGYLMSCLGAFIGLRCATRARAHAGTQRALWLLLASVSLGATGIWAMHFIAMLGFTIPGQPILYKVPLTIFSMVVAVVVVTIGLFIVGFGNSSMHYLGMKAISMPEMMSYNIPLVVLSVLIAIVAGTAALWAGLNVRGIWSTIAASLIFGVAVSGMHYTGMAAMHLNAGNGGIYGAGQNTVTGGVAASGFVLPLVLGIGIFSFLALIVIMLAPSEDEIRADARLAERLADRPASHRR